MLKGSLGIQWVLGGEYLLNTWLHPVAIKSLLLLISGSDFLLKVVVFEANML